MWGADTWFLGVRGATILAAGVALAVAALVHGLLHAAIRGQLRENERNVPAGGRASDIRGWIVDGLKAVRTPLLLLVWIVALHAALSLVLADLSWTAASAAVVRFLDPARGIALLAGLVWLLSRVGRAIETRFAGLGGGTDSPWDDLLLPLVGRACRLLLPLLALIVAAPALAVSAGLETVFRSLVSLSLIGTVAALLVQLVTSVETLVLNRYRLDASDNLEARKVYTQVTVLRKVALVVIGIFTLASMLMVFESVRQFGMSILASAGLAGIIIGFAAQRSIATLIAGFQIAITQPIRLDDVVIVENEWGRIEEITLTYVVVRIWDLRRLVLPITYFLEQPFQNWTRSSADILGTVFLHVDYTTPIDALRQELTRVLSATEWWDGKVNVLQVTDARDRTIELRALASASDAGRAWNLRCEVREKLIGFLQANYPECLPKMRASVTSGSQDVADASPRNG